MEDKKDSALSLAVKRALNFWAIDAAEKEKLEALLQQAPPQATEEQKLKWLVNHSPPLLPDIVKDYAKDLASRGATTRSNAFKQTAQACRQYGLGTETFGKLPTYGERVYGQQYKELAPGFDSLAGEEAQKERQTLDSAL